jgi:SH3 domain-containing YSC84-like protein 1
MLKHFVIVSILALTIAPVATASDRDDAVNRTRRAAEVFQEIMQAPDGGMPHDLLQRAKCIAIIPGDKKAAFVVGGNYGRGVVSCRTAERGWSAPLFLGIEGGSVGFQIGGSSTDLVLLFMNDHALHSLLSDHFKLGADASVAAGPVGRNATAATDAKLNAEILSYSRSKGAFAGVSLNGSVVKADKSADEAVYGPNVDRHDILSGKARDTASAHVLEQELSRAAS